MYYYILLYITIYYYIYILLGYSGRGLGQDPPKNRNNYNLRCKPTVWHMSDTPWMPTSTTDFCFDPKRRDLQPIFNPNGWWFYRATSGDMFRMDVNHKGWEAPSDECLSVPVVHERTTPWLQDPALVLCQWWWRILQMTKSLGMTNDHFQRAKLSSPHQALLLLHLVASLSSGFKFRQGTCNCTQISEHLFQETPIPIVRNILEYSFQVPYCVEASG
jgi:hypothetical protein